VLSGCVDAVNYQPSSAVTRGIKMHTPASVRCAAYARWVVSFHTDYTTIETSASRLGNCGKIVARPTSNRCQFFVGPKVDVPVHIVIKTPCTLRAQHRTGKESGHISLLIAPSTQQRGQKCVEIHPTRPIVLRSVHTTNDNGKRHANTGCQQNGDPNRGTGLVLWRTSQRETHKQRSNIQFKPHDRGASNAAVRNRGHSNESRKPSHV